MDELLADCLSGLAPREVVWLRRRLAALATAGLPVVIPDGDADYR